MLSAGASALALVFAANAAFAQPVDIGTVQGTVAKKKVIIAKKKAPAAIASPAQAPAPSPDNTPIASDQAVGTGAPAGSAPALAPSQASLNANEPGSVVSNKVLRDVVVPSGDYNEAPKYTPGYYSNNPNGPLGDSKSGWRGFSDGQFNITYDGVPFGDANDPSHHSAANFPGPFIGSVIVDRGPGAASQVGYATFGGTMSLNSRDLNDKAGSEVTGSIGNFGTYTGSATSQSGRVDDTRAMLQLSYNKTDGALDLAHVDNYGVLGKVEKTFDGVTATLFGTYARENYNNTNSPTYAQLQKYGNTYAGLNNDPRTENFTGYNNSQKQTDLEYLDLKGRFFGWQLDNKVYTYSYWYPDFQNNGNDQTIDGIASIANGGTVNKLSITNPPGGCVPNTATCKTTITFAGVTNGDVTGFLKFNDLREYGDIFKALHDVNAGAASGQLRAGVWVEHVDNSRYQQYYDYTKGTLYPNLGPSITTVGGATAAQQAIDLAASSYKLDLQSHITNYQPYAEYEWTPTSQLAITSGIKYESFERHHVAAVNQTTLQPADFDKTYTATLPSLEVRYKATPDLTFYGQASKGFLAPGVAAYYVYNFDSNDIAPEMTTNYQAGVNYKTRSITASADLYQITATNFPVTTKNPDGTSTLTNAGTARYQGVEAEGTYAFGNGLAAYSSGAISNATFIDGPNTGLAVPNAPRYTLAGGFIYDRGAVFGSLLHKITGDQYGSAGQVAASASVNPELNHVGTYNSTDIVAGVRGDALKVLGVGNNAELKFGVSNIFDNRNIVDIGGAPKGLVASDAADAALSYTSQAGRVYYGAFKVQF